jgi:hypothetical protein
MPRSRERELLVALDQALLGPVFELLCALGLYMVPTK